MDWKEWEDNTYSYSQFGDGKIYQSWLPDGLKKALTGRQIVDIFITEEESILTIVLDNGKQFLIQPPDDGALFDDVSVY